MKYTMKYTMKCTKQTVEPFFTLDKEYQIAHNNTLGYFIKDDNNEIVGDGKTREELLNNLNEYWYSQFELIVIDGDKENKVLLTLDENKELTINIKKADEALDLKLECDMWKEEHEKVRQKYIDKDVELQIVDRIVLQYEQRINELEEQLNELHRKRH